MYAAEEDTDDKGQEIAGLVTEHVLSANRRSSWVVDSGVTCHMCDNQKLFDQIIGLEMPQEITVGDGHSVQATGWGDVILRMNVLNGKIWNVSYQMFCKFLIYHIIWVYPKQQAMEKALNLDSHIATS